MKDDWVGGYLVHWARDSLGLALDAEFSISAERAKELMAQMAKGDADRPFMELVVAYGRQMRRILAARIKDAREMEEAENEFWASVVQNAGNYNDKWPVEHWLSVIASRQAISVYRRQCRRSKFVAYRAEMASKMLDSGEREDDLDLERLADKDAIAEERELTPDKILEQEELAKAAHRVVMTFLGSLDAETAEAIIRNKVEGITFEAWAKRTGEEGELLRMRVSRAYRKMRKKIPLAVRMELMRFDR